MLTAAHVTIPFCTEWLTAGQLRILEEECAVRGSIVMKDGGKMKTQDVNGICCNELGKKRSRGGKVQRKTVSAHCVKKGRVLQRN